MITAPTYATFELRIQPGLDDGVEALVTRSLAGDARGPVALPVGGLDPGEFPPDVPHFGAQLYRAVFAGEVGSCLLRSLDEAQRRGAGLRIRLRIDDRLPALADLPWELLYAPELGGFLALSIDTPLLRYLETPHATQFQPIQPPLVVLAVLSAPADVPSLAVEREWEHLQHAFAGLSERSVRIERVQATWPALQARLRQGPAHVLHFVGHGFFDAEQSLAGLVFEDDLGRASIVPAEKFAVLVRDHDPLRLVFLNACDGAVSGRSDPFAGVAQQLVMQGMPAVVAMQFPIGDAAAVTLSREFYRSLSDGYPVDAALGEARKAVFGQSDTPEWCTPVLFSRSDDNRLVGQAQQTAGTGVKIAAPPEPLPLPDTADFVGRERELAKYASGLATGHVAVLAGMAGIGKTVLAARLAQQVAASPDRIFWHQFHEDEGIETIIWRLAGMLYRHGRQELWALLEGTRQSGGQPPPAELLLDYLVQLLRGQGFVLCLDDFHHAEDDPLVEKAVDRLQALLKSGDVDLIVTSRRKPAMFRTEAFEPLSGLNLADAADLLAAQHVALAPGLLADLVQRTDGNAELLTLAAHALRRHRDPEQAVRRLAGEDDVERFLLTEVDEGLSGEERLALSGVAVLLGHPGTRDAIEAALAAGSLKRTLRYLANRFLLREQEGRLDQEYVSHAIVQAFYYDLLSRKERQEMHCRAGEHYERAEPDVLKAAMHYQRGDAAVRAAELVAAEEWGAVYQGQARAQQQILEQFTAAQLPPALWAQIQLRLGEIHHYFRRSPEARRCYEQALAVLDSLVDGPKLRGQRALVCRRVGQLLGYESPSEALAWTERGLALVGDGDREERAALLVQRGALLALLADFDAGVTAVEEGLVLVDGEIGQVTVDGLTNLGNIYSTRGDVARGRVFTERALVLARQLHDPFRALKLAISLGADKFDGGDRAGGIAETRQALALAEQLGAVKEQALITLNLGDMLREQGDLDEAARYASESLRLARQGQLRRVEVAATINLAHLALARGQVEETLAHLDATEALARELGAEDVLPEILTVRAEALLARGDAGAALACAEQAVTLAEMLEMEMECQVALSIRAKVLVLLDQLQTRS